MPLSVKHLGKLVLRPEYRRHQFLKYRLRNIPRYTPTSTSLFGRKVELVDAASFLFMYKEIFEQQIYRFKARHPKPLILDCGANVGLSIFYFKQLYPESQIVAFEPDNKVFQVLTKNVHELELTEVELIDKAVWSSQTTIEFMSEGADAGRVTQHSDQTTSGSAPVQDQIEALETYQVQTVRLRDYLTQPVDFLKVDIEGAETEVIKDCRDLLFNVENLFIEYHSFADEPQTLNIIVNILSEAGFRLHIHPPVTSAQPFYRRSVHLGMDMQLNIFAFRE